MDPSDPVSDPSPPERDLFGNASPTGTWEHRRGEPRAFAFLWVGFLVLATLATLVGSGAGGMFTPESFRPNAQLLIATLALGGCVLWPMFRLSQRLPACGGPRSCVRDLFILVIGAQLIIWPQSVQPSGWPVESLLALAAFVPAWYLLVGGVLAWALGPGVRGGSVRDAVPRPMDLPPRARAAWMLGLLAITVLSTALVLLIDRGAMRAAGGEAARPGWLISPITGVYELTRERAWLGQLVTIERSHWSAIALLATAGVIAWIPALARRRGAWD